MNDDIRTITDEMIERAARALWDEPGWGQASPEQRQHHREAAERAISATAPLIAAQALRDEAIFPGSQLSYAAREWLRARADRIEAGR